MAITYSAANNTQTVQNLNPLGSPWASRENFDTTNLIAEMLQRAIIDNRDPELVDMKIMMMMARESGLGSDEFKYKAIDHQREAITVTTGAALVTAPAQQTITVSSLNNATPGMLIAYPNGKLGTIVSTNTSTNQITVRPRSGDDLPAAAINDTLSMQAFPEPDGVDGVNNFFRAETYEKDNYIAVLARGMRYNRLERWKKEKMATTNFLDVEDEHWFQQWMIDQSNLFWNGRKGEYIVGGEPVKIPDGLHSDLISNNAPQSNATLATLPTAVQTMSQNVKFKKSNRKFVFATDELLLPLSEAYKTSQTRYEASDKTVDLDINQIIVGNKRMVLVPMNRWKDLGSFPPSFQNRMYVVDPEEIIVKQMWGEEFYKFGGREAGNNRTYWEKVLTTTLGFQFNDSTAHGIITVS